MAVPARSAQNRNLLTASPFGLLPAELYAQSVFCLQPPGDTLARTAIVEVCYPAIARYSELSDAAAAAGRLRALSCALVCPV